MSTLRELDASAEAAEACERAAVSLKRATRDVEASARGFGLEPNAVARARQLCAEVTRLASRTDAAIAAAQDAAALEASRTIHDAFLTPAEDRAATRERLASAPAEPVRVQLVRFRDPKSANANAITAPRGAVPFLFHRRRAPAGPRRCDPDADARSARDAMRALLIEVRKKLDAPTAVAGLFRADGARARPARRARRRDPRREDGQRREARASRSGKRRRVIDASSADARRIASYDGPGRRERRRVRRVAAHRREREAGLGARRETRLRGGREVGVAAGRRRSRVCRVPREEPSRASRQRAGEGAGVGKKNAEREADLELARPKPVWVRSLRGAAACAGRGRAGECGKARLDARPREGAGGHVFGNPRGAALRSPAGSSPARRSPCGSRPGAPSSGTPPSSSPAARSRSSPTLPVKL